MPHGFFTLEQWKAPKRGAKPQWMAIRHLPACQSLSDAIRLIEAAGKPGFFRVVQIQRMIWAERQRGRLTLRRWHAMTPESLARTADAFDRDGGVFPVPATRERRVRVKESRKKR